jgi:hypothetical protein
MLKLDHLSVIAPSLAEGVDHVRRCLDIDVPFGRIHPYMGTHNHLLRLGDDIYLEIVAADPGTPPPAWPRWFGLDNGQAVRAAWDSGRRLRAWVARTANMDAVLPRHEAIVGRKTLLSAGGVSFSFSIPPGGALPGGGVAPSVIDRGDRPVPAASMPDLGASLRTFTIEHPDPGEVAALYQTLQVEGAPQVREGPSLRYSARIQTPGGLKELH